MQALKSETAAFLIDGHIGGPRVQKNTRESFEMQTESVCPTSIRNWDHTAKTGNASGIF
jgi:hypothetical protein